VEAAGRRVSAALRRSVEQRLVYALSRFGGGVERVAVRIADRQNVLGGVDRSCRMRAWLKHRESVAVETLDGPGAIDRAADRLAARVEWALVNGRAETLPEPLPGRLALPARRTSRARSTRRRSAKAARRMGGRR
jgi:hypothetical protein